MSTLVQKFDTEIGREIFGKVTLHDLAVNIADVRYVHYQNIPELVWIVNHNLNKQPSVTVVDSAGTTCYGHITYIDSNSLELRFSAQFSGKAYLN